MYQHDQWWLARHQKNFTVREPIVYRSAPPAHAILYPLAAFILLFFTLTTFL